MYLLIENTDGSNLESHYFGKVGESVSVTVSGGKLKVAGTNLTEVDVFGDPVTGGHAATITLQEK